MARIATATLDSSSPLQQLLNNILLFPKRLPNVIIQTCFVKEFNEVNNAHRTQNVPSTTNVEVRKYVTRSSKRKELESGALLSPPRMRSNRDSLSSVSKESLENSDMDSMKDICDEGIVTKYTFKVKKCGSSSRKLLSLSEMENLLQQEYQKLSSADATHTDNEQSISKNDNHSNVMKFNILDDFLFLYNDQFIELRKIFPKESCYSFEEGKKSGIKCTNVSEVMTLLEEKFPGFDKLIIKQVRKVKKTHTFNIASSEDATLNIQQQDNSENIGIVQSKTELKESPTLNISLNESATGFSQSDDMELFQLDDDGINRRKSLVDSSNKLQNLFSNNNIKRLKRLQYLDDVFSKGKDTYIPRNIRENLLGEYERLAAEEGADWKNSLKNAQATEIVRETYNKTAKREWKPDEEIGEEAGEEVEEEEDEWSDAVSEASNEFLNADENQAVDNGNLIITLKNVDEEESRKRKREEEEAPKPKKRKVRKKSKNELKREIMRWSSVLSILAARYRVLYDTVISEEMEALLVSLNDYDANKTLSSTLKWINFNFNELKKLKESLTLECSETEFRLLLLLACIHFSDLETFCRLVVRLDPTPYNQVFNPPKSIVYIDCEPPENKDVKKEDAFPSSNLKVEVYLNDTWKCIQLSANGNLSMKKVIKPQREKLEFPVFYIGIFPDTTINLSEKYIYALPAKDTGIVQTNFDKVTQFFKKSICPANLIDKVSNKKLKKILKEEKKALDAVAEEHLYEVPKTQGAFRNHPIYILDKFISRYYAVYPKDTPPVAMHGDYAVYKRTSLALLHTRDRWLSDYLLEVRPEEMESPYKIVKSLVSSKKGMTHLFGEWQTRPYIPPLAENGIVPKNERGQVDLWNPGMLPRGCVHMSEMPYITIVCRKLKIDYAPCMVGFEIKHNRNVPKFDGVVICSEFESALREAYVNYIQLREQRQEEKRVSRIYGNWKKLLRGLLAREKVSRLFARHKENDDDHPHRNANESSDLESSQLDMKDSCETQEDQDEIQAVTLEVRTRQRKQSQKSIQMAKETITKNEVQITEFRKKLTRSSKIESQKILSEDSMSDDDQEVLQANVESETEVRGEPNETMKEDPEEDLENEETSDILEEEENESDCEEIDEDDSDDDDDDVDYNSD